MVSPWRLREIRRLYDSGGVFAYPTEAVYGLGCNPLNPDAVERILKLKQRSVAKGLILIASDWEQLRPFVLPLSDESMRPIYDSWPGPNTWLLPSRPGLPSWLRGTHETLAVRITDHPVAAALCQACQAPLVSTSANTSGQNPALSSLQVRKQFPYGIDHIISAPLGDSRKPSTIRDGRTRALLRA